jgi:hypothetical protein
VDDVTAAEVIASSIHSRMQHVDYQINQWSQANHSLLNLKKTKEFLFKPIQKALISVNKVYAERVRSSNYWVLLILTAYVGTNTSMQCAQRLTNVYSSSCC